jgi:hypothetical protein
MFFLLFLLDDRMIRIRISDEWIRIRISNIAFLNWERESNLFILSGCRTSVTATRRIAHPAPTPSGRCPSTSSIEGTIRILTRTSPAATSSPLAQTFTTSKTRNLPAAYHIWTCELVWSKAITSSPLAQTFTTSKTRNLPAAYHIWTCELA